MRSLNLLQELNILMGESRSAVPKFHLPNYFTELVLVCYETPLW